MRLNRLAFFYPRKIVDHLLNLLILSGSVYCAQFHRLLLEVSIALNAAQKKKNLSTAQQNHFMQIPSKETTTKNDEPTHSTKSMI